MHGTNTCVNGINHHLSSVKIGRAVIFTEAWLKKPMSRFLEIRWETLGIGWMLFESKTERKNGTSGYEDKIHLNREESVKLNAMSDYQI